jgi:predicted Zn finger-like uncharacterized protein
MSLITRCPACTTLFKVVPDQLRVSEGWVRCGQCDEVFDANAHLQSTAAAPTAQAPITPPLSTPDSPPFDVESGVDTEPQMPVDPDPDLERELSAKLEWPQAASSHYDPVMDVRPGAVFEPEPVFQLEIPGEPEQQVFEPPVSEHLLSTDPEPRDAESDASWRAPALQMPPEPDASSLDAAVPDFAADISPAAAASAHPTPQAPTFMRVTRKPSVWERPWARRGLVALSVLLLTGLAFQVVQHERDRLAASAPELRPALMAMCAALDCQIAPFRQIDAVVIDASSFVKVRGDVYRLNITLKNTSPMDVAAPSVELTLTDTQEQAMIRHVLSATDLGAQQATLVAGGELSAALPINVKTAGSAERISGYRLLAFYP